MFETILSALQGRAAPKKIENLRRHERRERDQCVSVIAGKTYPVENWSPGGVLIFADGRPFKTGQTLDITMKFKLRDEVIEVPHRGTIVRRSHEKLAFEFLPLTHQIRKNFQSVIDDAITASFAESQMV